MPITETLKFHKRKSLFTRQANVKRQKTQASDVPPQVGFKSAYGTRKQDGLGAGESGEE